MKRLVILVLLLALCGVVIVARHGLPQLNDLVRRLLERAIARTVGQPTRIQQLSLSALPPALHLEGVEVGSEPPLLQLGHVDLRLLPFASLQERRPVLELNVQSLTLDVTRHEPATSAPAAEPSATNVPALHLTTFAVTDAHVRFPLGKTVATLSVEQVDGNADTLASPVWLTAGLQARGLELQHKSYTAMFNGLEADGGIDAGGLFVHTASLHGEQLTASVRATDPQAHTIAASFDPAVLGVFVDGLSLIGGHAQLDGTLHGNLANPSVDATLAVEGAAIAGHLLGDLTSRVRRHGTHLDFGGVRLVGTSGEASGAVELNIDREVPIHGALDWQAVDLERMLAVIGVRVPFRNRFDAATTVDGGLDPVDLTIDGKGVLRRTDAESQTRLADWHLGGRVREHDLHAQLELTQPQRNQAAVSFAIEGHDLSGSIRLSAPDVAALGPLLPQPVQTLALSGRADGSAAFSGTTEHPAVGGTISLQSLTVVGTAVPRVSGDFTIAASRLTTQRTTVETRAGTAEFNGALALDAETGNEWQLVLRDLDADLLAGLAQGFTGVHVPVSGGTVSGSLHCRGLWRQADAAGQIGARSLLIGREPFDRVDVEVTTALPKWAFELHAVHAATETLVVNATGEGRDRLNLGFDSSTDLARWRGANRRRLVGTVTLHGRLSGALERPDGWLEVAASGLEMRGHHLGEVSGRADGRRGEWTMRGQAFAGTVDVEGTLRTTGTVPYTLNMTWRDPDLAAFIASKQSFQVSTSGDLRLGGSLQNIRALSGSLAVSRFEVTRAGYQIAAPQPIRVDVNDGRFRIQSLALEGVDSRLTVVGGWTVDGDANLELRGSGDLSFLELLGPPIYSARGQVTAHAQLIRTHASGWDLDGQVSLRDAALDADFPVSFTDTNGNFLMKGSQISIAHLNGRAGGGEFTVGGALDVNRGPALTWSVHEVGLSVPEWLEERISGQGQVLGSWRALTVSGDIEVLNALYDRRTELGDLLPFFKQQLSPAPRVEPEAMEIRLDLHIHATGGLFVDNNLAKIEMRADVRLGGTAAKPALTGTVELLDGEITFRDRIFTITAGSLEFQEPYKFNPVLNLSAESQISTADGEYQVTLVVTGTAENPRVQLSADDPNLTQKDIITLITSGKTTAQLQREGGGVSAADLLALVPTAPVEQRFRGWLGVNTFEITPTSDRDTGTIQPRVTIGKQLTDRLRAQAGSNVGIQTRPNAQLEYRYTRGISLLGSWSADAKSQAGAFGGEVRFRYEFRTLPFSLWNRAGASAPENDAR